MSQKISLVTTAHNPLDDRIFYHFAKSLLHRGYKVSIVCSTKNSDECIEGVTIVGFSPDNISQKDKLLKLIDCLKLESPNIAICSEPLAILAAHRYRKTHNSSLKIIFDVTEWYPSKVNLIGIHGINKLAKAIKLLGFNIYTSFLCNGFIFGERFKSLPYKWVFPRKCGPIISYYPNLEYINYCTPSIPVNEIILCFTGKLCEEKGFFNFLNVAAFLEMQRPDLKIVLKIVGWFASEKDEELYNRFVLSHSKIVFHKSGYLAFYDFLNTISNVHIFFDLRKPDFQNNHCLPIKLFYYMAFGRPVIYSHLKAIRNELDISSFGKLVQPNNYAEIASFIINYIDDAITYRKHCANARYKAEKLYNWQQIEQELLNYISKF